MGYLCTKAPQVRNQRVLRKAFFHVNKLFEPRSSIDHNALSLEVQIETKNLVQVHMLLEFLMVLLCNGSLNSDVNLKAIIPECAEGSLAKLIKKIKTVCHVRILQLIVVVNFKFEILLKVCTKIYRNECLYCNCGI